MDLVATMPSRSRSTSPTPITIDINIDTPRSSSSSSDAGSGRSSGSSTPSSSPSRSQTPSPSGDLGARKLSSSRRRGRGELSSVSAKGLELLSPPRGRQLSLDPPQSRGLDASPSSASRDSSPSVSFLSRDPSPPRNLDELPLAASRDSSLFRDPEALPSMVSRGSPSPDPSTPRDLDISPSEDEELPRDLDEAPSIVSTDLSLPRDLDESPSTTSEASLPAPIEDSKPETPSSIVDVAQTQPLRNPFQHKESAAEQEWKRQKAEGATNAAIDDLMELVGLEEVKEQVLAIKAKVETCEYQGTDLKKERFNIVFQGNPGTGKTTVARIYARFLHSVGVLDSENLKETSGAKLASLSIGKKKVKKIIGKIVGTKASPSSGVLFVDEAYQLTAPHTSAEGRQALDYMLTEMENRVGQLVVIFVGYNKEMESFYEHNPGLASRIPYNLQFADFDDAELWKILHDNINSMYKGRMKVEGGLEGLYMRIAVRRLSRGRGIRGFGNARAVDNLLAKIRERQARRLVKERKERRCSPKDIDHFYFTKEDLIGPDPSQAIGKSTAWKKLNELIGLDSVKKSAVVMKSIIETNYIRELAEQKPLDFSLNRVFYGSPGTGKTTVAKLYGQIMADLGLLSNGEVVIKSPADFIGECLGKSESKTRAILATTLGKVLIIDEAYMLDSGGPGKQNDIYRAGVIDTLVAEVQSVPGDDRCILLLGYEDRLKEMFRNVNPGLSRRFAIDNPFRFDDFNLAQLKEILQLKMRQQDLKATSSALDVAHGLLDRASMRPSFCNGGEVESCLTMAKLNYENRQLQMPLGEWDYSFVLKPQDFDPDFNRDVNAGANCRKRLTNMVADYIIDQLEEYQKRAQVAKLRGVDPRRQVPTNFVFKGPPGSGKTTTARSMGKLYYEMGFLSTDEVIECTTADFIGQYVGQTSPKTRAQLDKGLGKVLFIDEAYRLAEGQYAAEAVNELISLLQSQKYAGRMIVILAGYTLDMNKLMTTRPGLSGLFPEEITFKNIPAEDCLTLLGRELSELQISTTFLDDIQDYNKLRRLINALSIFPSWCNARQIRILAKNMSGCALKALSESSKLPDKVPLSVNQAISCIRRMFEVEYDRWSSQDGKMQGLSSIAAAQILGNPPEATQEPTPTATDQAATHSSGITQAAGSSLRILQDPMGINQAASGLFIAANGPVASPDEIYNSHMATESSTAHPHCTKIHTEGGHGDIDDQVHHSHRRPHTHQLPQLSPQEAMQLELEETKEKKEAVQKKLQQMGACNAGYDWVKAPGGYKCSANVCFISDGQLGL